MRNTKHVRGNEKGKVVRVGYRGGLIEWVTGMGWGCEAIYTGRWSEWFYKYILFFFEGSKAKPSTFGAFQALKG